MTDNGDNGLPPILADWIKERGFDACDWFPVPASKIRKVPGQDAYRFGQVVLVRLSLGPGKSNRASQSQETRYYAAIQLVARPGQLRGKSVGYWLALPPSVKPPTEQEERK
jgi:hypothetical protein